MAITSGWSTPKLNGRLKDYASASTGTMLLGSIQAHMIKEAARPSSRRQDIIHPSEMAKTNWCPRSTYKRIAACREASDPFLKPAEYTGVQLLNIFDEGHSIHDKWQRRLWNMGLLSGKWKCVLCGTLWDAVSPDRCPNVNSCRSGVYPADWEGHRNTLIYLEVPLKAEQYLISGHADGAIPSKKALIEIKSVGVGTARIEAPDIYKANSDGQKIDLQGLWRDIKEPFPSHINQGQLYLGISDLMGSPFDAIVFLYESKFNQGAKEFIVKYDASISRPLFEQANSIKQALDGFMPNGEDCDICKHKNLSYPFICECVDNPVKCITGSSCKDCEIYGTEKPDHRGLEPAEKPELTGNAHPRPTRRRTSGPSGRFGRPS